MAEVSRDAEIKGSWARYGWFYRLLRGAVLIGVRVLVGMLIYAEPQVRADYLMNLFVTVLGLGATALIFDELNRKRSEDDLKRQLVMDAGSNVNDVAQNAVYQMLRKGWLTGEKGLLRGANLASANLRNADLGEANLREANLDGADLLGTYLREANLEDANLSGANLQEANLSGANVQGADLSGANLREATCRLIFYDERTQLPDGSYVTSGAEFGRFTWPEHDDFFPVNYPTLPEYRNRHKSN